MGKFIDLTGQRFGRLVVVERGENYVSPQGVKFARWKCKCECGNETTVLGLSLRQGKTQSCGCQIGGHKVNCYKEYDNYVVGITNENIEFKIDKSDYDKIKDYCWISHDKGYIHTRMGNKMVNLHRFVMNAPDDMFVDHINGDKTDNRKCNLRLCTNSQNQMNAKTSSRNTSGVKGVSWINKYQKWRASIRVNGTLISLGQYKIFDDAVKARKEAEQKYFGEYSYDNSQKIGGYNEVSTDRN